MIKKILKFIFLFLIVLEVFAQSKFALCEVYTSSTCGPCGTANPQLDTWLSTYADKDKVVMIKYHVWWPSPGNDPYYLSNTTQNQSRATYYGINAAPTMQLNGTFASYSFSTWKTRIMSALTESPLLSISISGNLTTAGGEVKITLVSNGSTLPTGTMVLHTVLTESGLQYTGPNGDPNHESVMRKMYPSDAGEVIVFNVGNTKTFTRNVTFESGWKSNNMEVVAFLQMKDTKEILQAAKYKIKTSGVEDVDIIPTTLILKQNYPNPFNPETKIEFAIPTELNNQNVTLKVFDIIGREIFTIVDKNLPSGNHSLIWNATGAISGVYIYQLKVANKVITKSMTLLR